MTITALPRRWGRGPAVLGVTRDHDLIDHLRRLSAAAGADLQLGAGLADVRSVWADAALVLVGIDAVDAGLVNSAGLPRRGDVVLVACDNDSSVWERAVVLGAEHVAVLPDAEMWLANKLGDAAEGPGRQGAVVGVIGGRGGAGATVLSVALASTAADAGAAVLLVDADPWGAGVDVTLGAEDLSGLRWPDLASASGRVRGAVLRSALPMVDGMSVLSWNRELAVEVPAEAMAAVLDGGRRSCDLVVLDLPRRVDDSTRAALDRCDRLFVLVPADVRAAASAARVVAAVGPLVADVRLVVRGPAPTGLSAEVIAKALDLPLAGELRAERGLDCALDRGEVPGGRSRSPLAEVCRRLSADLLPRPRRAA